VAGEHKRPGDERRNPADPAELIGRQGIWTVQLQLERRVRVRVRIVNARRMFDRMDLEIETDVGDRAWVSDRTVEVL
jgi:hypothetical protein